MSESNPYAVDYADLKRKREAAAKVVQLVPEAQPEPVQPKPKARKPKAIQAGIKPVDVIKLARKRLREVRREINRLEKLRAEEEQLTRLLNAADNT